jgi:hypothetical protein
VPVIEALVKTDVCSDCDRHEQGPKSCAPPWRQARDSSTTFLHCAVMARSTPRPI